MGIPCTGTRTNNVKRIGIGIGIGMALALARTECEREDAVRAARVLVHVRAAHVAHGEALLQHVQHVVEAGAEALARTDQQRLPAFVLAQVQLLQRQRAARATVLRIVGCRLSHCVH